MCMKLKSESHRSKMSKVMSSECAIQYRCKNWFKVPIFPPWGTQYYILPIASDSDLRWWKSHGDALEIGNHESKKWRFNLKLMTQTS